MLKSLQACRGLAALAVAGFHLAGAYALVPALVPAARGAFFAKVFRHGNAGVDFFFVLSGFIIMFAHQNDIGKPDRLLRYARNRFVRLYPIYWFYSAVVVIAAVCGFSAVALPNGTFDWLSIITLVRFNSVSPPLNVAWTLFYEVAFYAIFSSLIINRKLGLTVMAAWFAAILIFHVDLGRFSVASVWASPLCANFFIGIAACLIYTRINRPVALAFAGLGAVLLIVAFTTVDSGLAPGVFGSFVALGCGLVIAGAAALENGRNWKVGPLAALGNSSYTLYLVHVHIQSPMLKIALRLGGLRLLGPDILFAVILGLTVLAAYVLYLIIERPLIAAFKTKRFTPRAATAAGAGT